MTVPSVIVHVSGRVQGVYFRESTRRKALELGISGTVRNLADGRVMIEAAGNPNALHEFIQWCHKGPPPARVEQVDVKEAPPAAFNGFEVLR